MLAVHDDAVAGGVLHLKALYRRLNESNPVIANKNNFFLPLYAIICGAGKTSI